MGNNRLKYIAAGLLLVCCFTSANAQMLSLDSCRTMALQHNKGSVISQESLLAAQEMRKAAFTQFLPSFNAAGAYMYNSKNISVLSEDALLPVGSISSDGKFTYTVDDIVTVPYGDTRVPVNSQGQPTTNPSEFVPKHVAYLPKESLTFDMEHVFAAGIGFTQPIFMGGKILSLYRMAQSAENIARIAKDNNDINIMIQVDEAYWRVVSLQKKVELAKEYNSLLQTTYNNVKIMYDEGVATKSDLLNVQVKLNESEMSLTKAENGLSLSKMYLNQICGMDFEQDYVLDGEIQTDNQNIDLDPDFKRDVALRPEAQMLDWNVKIAQSQVDIARSRFMPNIIASGNYVVSNPNLFNGFDKSFSGMLTFSVGVSVPVFHFGDRLHTLRAAKHNLRIAELTKEESLEKMQLQANMKRNSLTEAVKQNTMAANNLLHAEENMRQAQSGFEEGVISTSDLMAAQTSWVSAKSDVIDAKINMMLNELYLNQS
ncbi:MAG: TolC family protein, partial [Bacteroidales bacterium]|nr:TolC family protein [Bacteroidales bacterium]